MTPNKEFDALQIEYEKFRSLFRTCFSLGHPLTVDDLIALDLRISRVDAAMVTLEEKLVTDEAPRAEVY